MLRRPMMMLLAGLAAALLGAVPAHADPGNPCDLAVTFLCNFVPMAPDLDHDIDLTVDQPPVDPAAPPADSLPPVPICSAGCN